MSNSKPTTGKVPLVNDGPSNTFLRRSSAHDNHRSAEQAKTAFESKSLSKSSSSLYTLSDDNSEIEKDKDGTKMDFIYKDRGSKESYATASYDLNSTKSITTDAILRTAFEPSREPQFRAPVIDGKAIAYGPEFHARRGNPATPSTSSSLSQMGLSNEAMLKEFVVGLNSKVVAESLRVTFRDQTFFSSTQHNSPSRAMAKIVSDKIIDTVVRRSETFSADAIDRRKPPFDLTVEEIIALCDQLVSQYSAKANAVVSVQAPAKIFGDLHGNIQDLADFFTRFGKPLQYSGDLVLVNYIFNGDFVDRGLHSLEVVLTLFALRYVTKDKITLIRGNHECVSINMVYGFYEECQLRYPQGYQSVYEAINKVFTYLPLVAYVETMQKRGDNSYSYQKTMAVMHGGIGPDCMKLSEVAKIPLPIIEEDSCPAAMQLMWDDPNPKIKSGFERNPSRGDSCYQFSGEKVREFCSINGVYVIVRSHQCVAPGYELFAGGHMATVFSARNYTGVKGNHAAMILVAPDYVSGIPKISTCILEYTPPAGGKPQDGVQQSIVLKSPDMESKIESPSIADQVTSGLSQVASSHYHWIDQNWGQFKNAIYISEDEDRELRGAYRKYSSRLGFGLESLDQYLREITLNEYSPKIPERIMRTFDVTNFQKLSYEVWWIFLFTTSVQDLYDYRAIKGQFRAMFLFRYYDQDQDGLLSHLEIQDFVGDYQKAVSAITQQTQVTIFSLP
eukprot:TRINITY_DN4094_c0_g1_i1.p1 TRINITY_DN4094_c0_g1~~TRINITY_DN4094_c0_g1_i1.p1  ORF type:complete len:730 (+),score=129.29 TRINITY_DN4094_c0_g1_i1:95-2284(+)